MKNKQYLETQWGFWCGYFFLTLVPGEIYQVFNYRIESKVESKLMKSTKWIFKEWAIYLFGEFNYSPIIFKEIIFSFMAIIILN